MISHEQRSDLHALCACLIEGGVYALIVFAVFAFGGVEQWARGMVQVAAGLIIVIWIVDRFLLARPHERPPVWDAGLAVPLALYVLVVLFQLMPLPAGWIRTISPATDRLYARGVPGYAEGAPFEAARLAPWVVERMKDRLPPAREDARVVPPTPARAGPAFAAGISPRRTLSLEPFATRQSLSLFVCYAGLFVVVLGHFRTLSRRRRLSLVGMITVAVVSCLGIIQALTWNGRLYWMREGDYKEVFGPFVNRNDYAAFAVTLLPVAISFALAAFRRVRDNGGLRPGDRPGLPLAVSVLVTGGIFLSLARAGILAAALAILVVLALSLHLDRWRPRWAVLGLLGVVSAAGLLWMGAVPVAKRVGTIFEGMHTASLASRVEVWRRALEMIADHPLLGTGLGTFRYAFLGYAPPDRSWWMTAHNEYVELACDVGLLGTALLVVVLVAFAIRVARPWVVSGRPERFVYIGLLSGIAALLFHSATNASLQAPANAILLVVFGATLLGLVSDRGGGASGSREEEPVGTFAGTIRPGGARVLRYALLVVSAAALFANTVSGVHKIMASRSRSLAHKARDAGDLERALALLARARSWEPDDPRIYLETSKLARQAIAFDVPLGRSGGRDPIELAGVGLAAVARGIGLNPAHAVGWFHFAALYESLRAARTKREAMRAGEVAYSGVESTGRPGASRGLDAEDRIAMAAVLQAASLEPGGFLYRDYLAGLLWQRGLIAESSEQIRTSFTLMPRVDLHGDVLGQEGLPEALSEAILSGVAAAPENRLITPAVKLRARAEFLNRISRIPEAIAAYKRLREMGGGGLTAECDVMIGRLEQRRHRLRESLPFLRRAAAAKSSPRWAAQALYFMGRAHSLLDEHDEAARVFRRYLERRPDTALSYQALGKEMEALGRDGEAERLYAAAITRFPDKSGPYVLMIRLLRRLGRDTEARSFEKILAGIDVAAAEAN